MLRSLYDWLLFRIVGRRLTPLSSSEPSLSSDPAMGGSQPLINKDVHVVELRALYYEGKIQQQADKAVEWTKKGNRDMALHCMMRRKRFIRELQNTNMLLDTLEDIDISIQTAATNKYMSDRFKELHDDVKKLHAGISGLKDVDATKDEMQQTINQVEHASEALSGPLSPGRYAVDDSELERELTALLESVQPSATSTSPAAAAALPPMPDVPRTPLPVPITVTAPVITSPVAVPLLAPPGTTVGTAFANFAQAAAQPPPRPVPVAQLNI